LGLAKEKIDFFFGLGFGRGFLEAPYIDNMVFASMKQINYMSHTIDDFRKFFKPDTKKSVFNLKNEVSRVCELVLAALKAHNTELCVEIDDKVSVYGYENELLQVFLNIINCPVSPPKNPAKERE